MSVISGESKFGLDIGATTGGVLVWDVVAPEEGPSAALSFVMVAPTFTMPSLSRDRIARRAIS
jgi:hypothetical protein